MAIHQDNRWQTVPCHFVWDLESNVHVDFQAILNNLDSKLETRGDVQWTDSACDLLLFRGYLEVSKFTGVRPNPRRAEEFFLEAEREAMKVTNDEERKAYITVATANRLWIMETLDPSREGDANRREHFLKVLEQNWMDYPDEVKQAKVQAYIDTVAAFAMSRLGPNKCKDSETRYQGAIMVLGESSKSSWFHALGAMIGRQVRVMMVDGTYGAMNDEIRCYEKALEMDPANDSARCDLANILRRDPNRMEEARQLIQQVRETTCENIIKKARFYRQLKDPERALEVLRAGENLQHPRSDLFYQFAIIYKYMAKGSVRRTEYLDLESEYLDKCLQLEPAHLWALLDKAYSFSKRWMYSQADDLLRWTIGEFKSSPLNLIQAQFKYGGFLTYRNSNYMNEAAAHAYEDVVTTAISILSTEYVEEGSMIKRDLLPKAKERLTRYYMSSVNGSTKLRNLNERMATIGF